MVTNSVQYSLVLCLKLIHRSTKWEIEPWLQCHWLNQKYPLWLWYIFSKKKEKKKEVYFKQINCKTARKAHLQRMFFHLIKYLMALILWNIFRWFSHYPQIVHIVVVIIFILAVSFTTFQIIRKPVPHQGSISAYWDSFLYPNFLLQILNMIHGFISLFKLFGSICLVTVCMVTFCLKF